MIIFQLPIQIKKDKSITKKCSYEYVTTKQKQLFIDVIDKIHWQNKLASHIIVLEGIEVQEIQIFEINLNKRTFSYFASNLLKINALIINLTFKFFF